MEKSKSSETHLPEGLEKRSGCESQPILGEPPWNPWAELEQRQPQQQRTHYQPPLKNRTPLMPPRSFLSNPNPPKSSSTASIFSSHYHHPPSPKTHRRRHIKTPKTAKKKIYQNHKFELTWSLIWAFLCPISDFSQFPEPPMRQKSVFLKWRNTRIEKNVIRKCFLETRFTRKTVEREGGEGFINKLKKSRLNFEIQKKKAVRNGQEDFILFLFVS